MDGRTCRELFRCRAIAEGYDYREGSEGGGGRVGMLTERGIVRRCHIVPREEGEYGRGYGAVRRDENEGDRSHSRHLPEIGRGDGSIQFHRRGEHFRIGDYRLYHESVRASLQDGRTRPRLPRTLLRHTPQLRRRPSNLRRRTGSRRRTVPDVDAVRVLEGPSRRHVGGCGAVASFERYRSGRGRTGTDRCPGIELCRVGVLPGGTMGGGYQIVGSVR
mmetsp:Transcript_25757/g.75979  ORF Transcript_25757/g.75979 Transcript_25757/m.75979 type:complete len:218 (+) Transcript_25757:1116-1769(+)